jgi:cyclic pyranopterin phosphate synthase
MSRKLTHLDAAGRVRMVDVGAKRVTRRVAVARGRVTMSAGTLRLLTRGAHPKGDAIATAHLAGVLAAKRASDLIPLAHSLPLDAIDLTFTPDPSTASVGIEARVATRARTGVEMEALVAVAMAALTLYDMLKSADRNMVIGDIALWEKRGGRSGVHRRRP